MRKALRTSIHKSGPADLAPKIDFAYFLHTKRLSCPNTKTTIHSINSKFSLWVSLITVLQQTIHSTCLGFCWKFQAVSIAMFCLQSKGQPFQVKMGNIVTVKMMNHRQSLT